MAKRQRKRPPQDPPRDDASGVPKQSGLVPGVHEVAPCPACRVPIIIRVPPVLPEGDPLAGRLEQAGPCPHCGNFWIARRTSPTAYVTHRAEEDAVEALAEYFEKVGPDELRRRRRTYDARALESAFRNVIPGHDFNYLALTLAEVIERRTDSAVRDALNGVSEMLFPAPEERVMFARTLMVRPGADYGLPDAFQLASGIAYLRPKDSLEVTLAGGLVFQIQSAPDDVLHDSWIAVPTGPNITTVRLGLATQERLFTIKVGLNFTPTVESGIVAFLGVRTMPYEEIVTRVDYQIAYERPHELQPESTAEPLDERNGDASTE